MDKEIEDLLHSLNIEVVPREQVVSSAGVREQKNQSSCDAAAIGETASKASKSFSWNPYMILVCFALALVAGLAASYGVSVLFTKKPLSVRILEEPCRSLFSFFEKEPHTARYISVSSPLPKASESSPIPDDETAIAYSSSFFFAQPLAHEEKVISELKNIKKLLDQKKKSLSLFFDQMGPFVEREHLRTLTRLSDEYLRLQLLSSSFFEEKVSSQEALTSSSPFMLHTSLFGGLPLQGCREVSQSALKIAKDIDALFLTFQLEKSLYEKALVALKIEKILEKVSSDRLLLLLIDVKELKKKLDIVIQNCLWAVTKKLNSFKEMRGLCILEAALSKKEVMEWKTFEEKHFKVPDKVIIENQNRLESTSPSPVSKIVWSCILNSFNPEIQENNDDTCSDGRL